MEARKHNYGTQCRLAPVTASYDEHGIPQPRAQYFYSSNITIDDPFWIRSKPANAEKNVNKGLLRPFAQGDNNMLEKAWVAMTSRDDSRLHEQIRSRTIEDAQITTSSAVKRSKIISKIASDHVKRHKGTTAARHQHQSNSSYEEDSATSLCCKRLREDVTEEFRRHFCSMVRGEDASLDPDTVANEIAQRVAKDIINPDNKRDHVQKSDRLNESKKTSGATATGRSPIPMPGQEQLDSLAWAHGHRLAGSVPKSIISQSPVKGSSIRRAQTPTSVAGFRPGASGGITGMPFARVEGPARRDGSVASSLRDETPLNKGKENNESLDETFHSQTPHGEDKKEEGDEEEKEEEGRQKDMCHLPNQAVLVTVGASKLHTVVLPEMQMKPIYWSPVNDIAAVTRATWFYKDTMLPVSSRVANQLEAGYQDLRPWSDVWQEEVMCALRIGADGEEKIAHQLWPKSPQNPRGRKIPHKQPAISADHYCAAHCFSNNAATDSSPDFKDLDNMACQKPFANYQVLFKDKRHAFLLNQGLQPSAYYDRRPFVKIMKGLTVGIPVVRGFNRKAWERLQGAAKGEKLTESVTALDEPEDEVDDSCAACEEDKDRGQITDLVLVAHGIGQKIAERVESFHFTHAINSFRRSVNLDLQNPVVQRILRKDQNGLMILPLNWRVGLTFEDGGPRRQEDEGSTGESFDLKDIEPDTIPAVRSMISDVMFDIPFYMSHHKNKMITALVSEANRVYRLWCRNNPGFVEKGRVHIIAHSLGSVMTVDILSRQPSMAPKIDLKSELDTKFFEFDTTNLFLVGSPVGFFLLLEKGALTPRQGRQKPGADAGDIASNRVAGEAGSFGCLAVDNVYNVLAKEDPIAYLLTGAVDAAYAAGLKKAYVPSTAQSWMKVVGSMMRQVIPGGLKQDNMPEIEPESEPEPEERPLTTRLPSQLELEVHDFTKEEIAEKKAYLLNDNGQLDWFLRSSGGPLEIQYLNMLSAHTSYWNNSDFIRLVCLEIGRKPGRAHTLRSMRAVKTERQTPGIKGLP